MNLYLIRPLVSEKIFQEFVHVRIVEVVPLWTDQNFANNFREWSIKEHFCELGIRSYLLCCTYRVDLATELTG